MKIWIDGEVREMTEEEIAELEAMPDVAELPEVKESEV